MNLLLFEVLTMVSYFPSSSRIVAACAFAVFPFIDVLAKRFIVHVVSVSILSPNIILASMSHTDRIMSGGIFAQIT